MTFARLHKFLSKTVSCALLR